MFSIVAKCVVTTGCVEGVREQWHGTTAENARLILDQGLCLPPELGEPGDVQVQHCFHRIPCIWMSDRRETAAHYGDALFCLRLAPDTKFLTVNTTPSEQGLETRVLLDDVLAQAKSWGLDGVRFESSPGCGNTLFNPEKIEHLELVRGN